MTIEEIRIAVKAGVEAWCKNSPAARRAIATESFSMDDLVTDVAYEVERATREDEEAMEVAGRAYDADPPQGGRSLVPPWTHTTPNAPDGGADPLGVRIVRWAVATFGPESMNGPERTMRTLEEAAELAQSEGVTQSMAESVISRVYSRPAGDSRREASQLALTLWAYCGFKGWDPMALANMEASRVESLPAEHWQRRHAAKAAVGIVASAEPNRSEEELRWRSMAGSSEESIRRVEKLWDEASANHCEAVRHIGKVEKELEAARVRIAELQHELQHQTTKIDRARVDYRGSERFHQAHELGGTALERRVADADSRIEELERSVAVYRGQWTDARDEIVRLSLLLKKLENQIADVKRIASRWASHPQLSTNAYGYWHLAARELRSVLGIPHAPCVIPGCAACDPRLDPPAGLALSYNSVSDRPYPAQVEIERLCAERDAIAGCYDDARAELDDIHERVDDFCGIVLPLSAGLSTPKKSEPVRPPPVNDPKPCKCGHLWYMHELQFQHPYQAGKCNGVGCGCESYEPASEGA